MGQIGGNDASSEPEGPGTAGSLTIPGSVCQGESALQSDAAVHHQLAEKQRGIPGGIPRRHLGGTPARSGLQLHRLRPGHSDLLLRLLTHGSGASLPFLLSSAPYGLLALPGEGQTHAASPVSSVPDGDPETLTCQSSASGSNAALFSFLNTDMAQYLPLAEQLCLHNYKTVPGPV